MLRDSLVELIEPMLNSAGTDPLALFIHNRTHASDDRLPCLKNPRPEGAESSLTENVTSPFQAEPAHTHTLLQEPDSKLASARDERIMKLEATLRQVQEELESLKNE